MSQGTDVPERIFLEVLDLACGHSLTARDAVITLSTLLADQGSLSSKLKSAENPARLLELLQKEVASDRYSEEKKRSLANAMELVLQSVEVPEAVKEALVARTPVAAAQQKTNIESATVFTPAPDTVAEGGAKTAEKSVVGDTVAATAELEEKYEQGSEAAVDNSAPVPASASEKSTWDSEAQIETAEIVSKIAVSDPTESVALAVPSEASGPAVAEEDAKIQTSAPPKTLCRT